jgi:hypothetical protein
MNSSAKSDLAIGISAEIQAVGFVEFLGIAVRGTKEGENGRTMWNQNSVGGNIVRDLGVKSGRR